VCNNNTSNKNRDLLWGAGAVRTRKKRNCIYPAVESLISGSFMGGAVALRAMLPDLPQELGGTVTLMEKKQK
jgi:chemotaxis response regulator CheB